LRISARAEKRKIIMEHKSQLTTLCYIEKDEKYLMMHRIKKKNDVNKDKWIGIGGHFEEGESPEECLLREVKEETGLTLERYEFRGIVTFKYTEPDSKTQLTEYMCLYTSDLFSGKMTSCDEGDLQWVEKEQIFDLPIWEGDKIFFRLLNDGHSFFSLKLDYYGEELREAVLDCKKIKG
jgi:8-oxo-dGTP diphosphatase